jgi:hypothetical protein
MQMFVCRLLLSYYTMSQEKDYGLRSLQFSRPAEWMVKAHSGLQVGFAR